MAHALTTTRPKPTDRATARAPATPPHGLDADRPPRV